VYRKLKFLYFFCLLFIFSCSKKQRETHSQQDFEKKHHINEKAFFVSVPITKFSSIHSPCLDICLDDVVYSVELDLGFRGYLTMYQDVVDRISTKLATGYCTMYGIRGKEYLNTLYDIPKISIGCMDFLDIPLQGEERDFISDGVFRKDDKELLPRDPGSIGWCLFRNSNLLVDTAKEKVVFCDSMENLQKHGYFLHEWTEVPMLLERGLVEFEATTSKGKLRCMLDTGATCNMLHNEGEQTIDEAFWDPKNEVSFPWFKIGNQDVGAISFRAVPIRLPISIEAILGMDFFSEHVVFLDFVNERILFAKS
jgi:hypothetical protein